MQIHLGLPFPAHTRSSGEEQSASNGKAEGANPSGSTFSKSPRSPIAEASVSETDQCRCNSDRGYHFHLRSLAEEQLDSNQPDEGATPSGDASSFLCLGSA